MVITKKTQWRNILALLVRRALQGVATLLGLLLVVLMLTYASGTFRARVAGWGLDLAADLMPGDIQIGELAWPELGRLQLTDVIWTDGHSPAQTMLQAPSIILSWDMRALRKGRVEADTVSVMADYLNLPGILALMQAPVDGAETNTAAVDSVRSTSPLHRGALPGIPSLSVGHWRVQCAEAVLSPELTVQNVDGAGLVELGFAREPLVEVEYLQMDLAVVVEDSISVESVTVSLDALALELRFSVEENDDISLALTELQLEFSRLNLSSLLPPTPQLSEDYDEMAGKIVASGLYTAPVVTGALDINLEATHWLDRGHLKGRGTVDVAALADSGLAAVSVSVDSLIVALLGTEIQAQGEWTRQKIEMHMQATVPDSQAIMLAWPDSLAPPRVRLALQAEVAGAPGDLEGELSLTDVLWIDGDHPDQVLVQASSLELAWDMDALQNGHVDVERIAVVANHLNLPGIQALLPASAGDSDAASTKPDSTDSTSPWHPGALPGIPSLSVEHWHVQCDLAVISPQLTVQNVDGAGSLELGSAREPRAEIEHLQMDLAVAIEDSSSEKMVTVSLDQLAVGLDFTVADNDEIALVLSELQLEFGELNLSSILPAGSHPPQEYNEVSGNILASGTYQSPVVMGMIDINLESTEWLDRAHLAGRAMVDLAALPDSGLAAVAINVDSLVFALLGTEVNARGDYTDRILDMQLQATIPDSQAVMLVWPDTLEPPIIRLDLQTTVAGTPQEFELDLDLVGQLEAAQIRVPQIDLHAHGNQSSARIELQMPAGLNAGGADLDSVAVVANFDQAPDAKVSGRYSLALKRDQDHLQFGGQLSADSLSISSLRTVVLDSLVFGGHGQSLQLQNPAILEVGSESGFLSLSPFEFSGTPGSINLGGEISPEGLDFSSVISLFVTEDELNRLAPTEFWSTYGGKDFSLESQIALGGTFAEPTLEGDLHAKLVSHRDDPSFGVMAEFAMLAGENAGANATMAITYNDTMFLRAELGLPGAFDTRTGVWTAQDSSLANFDIPIQVIKLNPLNRLLPYENELVGQVTGGLSVKVMAPDRKGEPLSAAHTRVDGNLSSKNLVVNLPNRSRLKTTFDLKLDGPLDQPKMSGEINVSSAFVRLPELPRNVHDFTGESELWNLAAVDSAAGDSVRLYLVPTSVEGPQLDQATPLPLPDMDIVVNVPGNFRVSGYGLDIELSGKLNIGRGFDETGMPQPTVQGQLETTLGTLKFMNRTFDVERGEVIFRGNAPPNPNLSLVLTTEVNGTLVRINVSGKADDPIAELTSEPSYEETDIMAILLFGQPMNNLDNDQRGGVRNENDPGQELRQNLAGLAVVFGTAGMQNSVTKTVGVDMVEVGADSDGESTLMVGKFINPRMMVKYHHSLTKSGTYFVTMEYTLTRLFRLISTYGQGEEDSGLELTWSRRY